MNQKDRESTDRTPLTLFAFIKNAKHNCRQRRGRFGESSNVLQTLKHYLLLQITFTVRCFPAT